MERGESESRMQVSGNAGQYNENQRSEWEEERGRKRERRRERGKKESEKIRGDPEDGSGEWRARRHTRHTQAQAGFERKERKGREWERKLLSSDRMAIDCSLSPFSL